MKRIVVSCCLCLLALGALAPRAEAGRRYLFTPKVTTSAEYNDDVQYLGKGDLVMTVNPELQLEIDSERTEHTITASMTRYKYADIDRLDRTENSLSLESVHRATERLTLRGNVSYGTDYALTTAEEEFGTTAERVERGTFSLGGRVEYMAHELVLLGLGYNYGSTQYDSLYVDTVGNTVSADISVRATERATLFGALSQSWYDSQFQDGGKGDYRATAFTVGGRYALTEIWSATVSGGLRKSSNTLDTGSIDGIYKDDGYIMNAGLEWDYERSDGDILYTHDSTTGLTGSRLDRDRVRIVHGYDITERQRLTGRAGITRTESDGVLQQSENVAWNAGLTWRYETTEDSTLWIGAEHMETENRINDTTKDRNRYFIRFEVAFPEEWSLGGAR